MLASAAAVATWLAAGASSVAGEQSGGPPPLVIDRKAPLLLEDLPDKPAAEPAEGPVADNGPCYVCHTNYETEEMVVEHARENVGCMDCHGKSYEHRDDEDNVTPPDVMFAQDEIDAACRECHDMHDVPAVKVITRWQERCPGKQNPKEIVCTDCHGQHRLAFRTVWWNKKTGELIIRGKERIKVAPDYSKKPPK
jgi:hypothetical protein